MSSYSKQHPSFFKVDLYFIWVESSMWEPFLLVHFKPGEGQMFYADVQNRDM